MSRFNIDTLRLHLSRTRSLEVVSFIFIFALKITFRKNENKKTISSALILTNDIQIMILNKVQEVLVVGRTPRIMLAHTVTFNLITRKYIWYHEKIFNYSVLESS